MRPPPPLRPFPLPLNVGTDICQISRIYSILNSPRRDRFISRVLAPEEVKEHGSRLVQDNRAREGEAKGSAAQGSALWKTAVFVAGRFAAKEATIKAYPFRKLTFHDVVIEKRPRGGDAGPTGTGPPVVRIKSGCGADDCALVSISHDGDYATAFCLSHG